MANTTKTTIEESNTVISAALPSNEVDRLAVLRGTNLLDTPAEDSFDAITTAVAQVCDMPIALICLVDTDRVWMKSANGIEGVSEVPRTGGFCPHTILQSDVFEVPDSRLDDRFYDSPLVTNAPHFLYYAGAPLVTNDGYALGTLCVMDYAPNQLSEDKKLFLKNMAKTAVALIEANKSAATLLKHELRYRELFITSPDAVFVHDPAQHKFLDCNNAALTLLGYTRDEILQRGPKDIQIDINEDGTANVDIVKRVDNQIIKNGGIERVEQTFLSKRGEHIPCEVTVSRHPFSDTFLTVATVSDIRERKQAQEREKLLLNELAHMTRINTMGALASGLAHELNQPLTAISQYCDTALSLIRQEPLHDELLTQSIDKARSQTMRAADIIRRVRSFVGKPQPARSTIYVNELLDETVQLLSQDIQKQKIELKIELEKNLAPIHADRVQLQQVLLNLMRNSIEAMESISSTRLLTLQCRKISASVIEFAVADTGPGIEHDVLDDLITPFDSNKPNGMGMGLCISNSIINAHDGMLWNDHNYKHGACLRFRLPIQEKAVAV